MGLLDFMRDPEQQGLLSAASSMLKMSGPSRTPISNLQVFGAGIDGFLSGVDAGQRRQFESAQQRAELEQYARKEEAMRRRAQALDRLRQGYAANPDFKPAFADLIEIDEGAALKSMLPNNGGFSLEPKVGKNPTTGKMGYFVQDRDGGTKWLDAEVPDNLKYVPGSEYQPAQIFDPRRGLLGPAGQGVNAQPPLQMGATAAWPQSEPPPQNTFDPAAPWNNLTSPKEQDQMKARVFEQDNKRLDDLRELLSKGRAIMGDLNRFGELNQQTGTGSLADRLNWPTFDPDKKEMEAIISRLGPQMRVPGSGADSDFEQKLRLGSLPSLGNYGDTNKAIREGYARQLEAAQSELNFRQSYLTEHGHLNGADQAYQTFLASAKRGGSASGASKAPRHRDTARPDWDGINARFAQGAPARENDRLGILQQELANATDPNDIAALQREISRVQPTAQTTGKKRTKAVQFEGGGSAFAELAPDGHYYVKHGGKRYRVED